MADSEEAAANCRARIELRNDLPDGLTMVPVDRPSETVLLVRTGLMAPELVDDWNRWLDTATAHTGAWQRTDPFEEAKGHPEP